MCQTDGCALTYRFITLDADDGSTEWECATHYLARNMAILQALGDSGDLGTGAQTAPTE